MRKLTSAKQKKLLTTSMERWHRVGMTSGPANVEALKPVFEKMYALIDLKPPEVLRFSSPLPCIIAILSRQHTVLSDMSRYDNWQVLRAYDACTLSYSTRNAIFDHLLLNLPMLVRAYAAFNFDRSGRSFVVSSDLETSMRAFDLQFLLQLRNNLGSYLNDELDKRLLYRRFGRHFSGSADLSWHAVFDFGLSIGREYSDWILARAPLWAEIARHSFWWWALPDAVILCDRPVTKWDEQRRLHCEDGAAISFSDGFNVYAWHGVFVPEEVVAEPSKQTLKEIHGEQNVEIRRIRIQRYGWDRYLRETRSRLIDSRRNEVEGINEALMRSPQGKVLVCACPSTARVYALQVPEEINTCQEAQIWLSGGLSKRITTAT